MLLEVEVELEDAPVEGTLESMPLGHFPLSIDDCKRDVLVRGASMEADRESVIGAVRLEVELWRLRLVCQVRVEDVELVALDDLGRRVLRVVVHLVVLVPFVTLLDAVEEAWFATDEELLRGLTFELFLREIGLLRTRCDDKISELLFVCIQALLLSVLVHRERRIVKSHLVNDVEPNLSVQLGLLNLLDT